MSATEKKLSDAALAVSADVQAELLDDEGNIRGEISQKPYVNHLERNDFSLEKMTTAKNLDRTYVAGHMHAVNTTALKLAAAAIEAGKEAPKKVVVSAPGVKGESFDVTWTGHDSGTMKGAEGQPDKQWNSYGSMQVRHRTVTKGKGGDVGTAMSLAAAAAEALLAPKA